MVLPLQVERSAKNHFSEQDSLLSGEFENPASHFVPSNQTSMRQNKYCESRFHRDYRYGRYGLEVSVNVGVNEQEISSFTFCTHLPKSHRRDDVSETKKFNRLLEDGLQGLTEIGAVNAKIRDALLG